MKNAVLDLCNSVVQLDRVKGRLSRWWYRYVNNVVRNDPAVCFLNYGYAPVNGETLTLHPADEHDRIYIQLYHRVASSIELAGRDALEVSCGRGGGARYVKQYLRPRTLCGLDRAANAVAFCRSRHAADGLHFTAGDAQRLPFASGSFDAVINVEASHDYPDIDAFFNEVQRVLRPGGHFLYADFRAAAACPRWREQIDASGLRVVEEEDITSNVLKGLELNTGRTNDLIARFAPRMLRPLFRQFAGVEGSLIYERFADGRSRYIRYLLRKDRDNAH